MRNAALVDGLRRSCKEAREELVAAYFQKLVYQAMGHFPLRREEAEELANDVLLAVILQIDRFAFRDHDGDFHCWIMTIFRRKAYDVVRKKARRHGLDRLSAHDPEVEMQESGECEVSTASPVVSILEDVVGELEAWERVLLMCRANEMPYAEIAGYAQKSPAQLKVYYGRVVRKLRRIIHERMKLLPSHVSLSGGAHVERPPGQM